MLVVRYYVTAEPTTKIAEDREDVPQAAGLNERAFETMLLPYLEHQAEE
jgi:hypothetical protein